MEIIQIVIICLCGVVFITILDTNKEFGVYISVMITVIVFFFVLSKFKLIMYLLDELYGLIDVDDMYFKILIQILGVTFITEFGANVCRDASRLSLSKNIEIAGKVIILFMSLPIIISTIQVIEKLI